VNQSHKQFLNLSDEVKLLNKNIKIIVVTKSQSLENFVSLIRLGHLDFGENRVQETKKKWSNVLTANSKLNLHLIGHLQTNKVTDAISLFNYIHTLDSEKLALALSNEEKRKNRKIKYFIQINVGEESQKTGIELRHLKSFKEYCLHELQLNIIGLMCIPPAKLDSFIFFKKLATIAKQENLHELSMGMSDDYKTAIQCGSTYLRIGRAIFGERALNN